MMAYKPVIIIGAPRSGTNMLRDILTSFDRIDTWPCDEINYIWRYGNARYPSDELPVANVTPRVKKYISNQFDLLAKKNGSEIIIEKTCANSLRVPFVAEIIPEAKYIFIVRDGVDATASAMKRWKAELDIPYILKKVRYVPSRDLPYYASRYLWARIHRIISKEKKLAFWGPGLDGMQEIIRKHGLDEVCALQWQKCVEKSDAALSSIPGEQVIKVRYEEFVNEPEKGLIEILSFMNKEVDKEYITSATRSVYVDGVGSGRKTLMGEEVVRVESLISDTLKKHGYI